MFTIKKIYQLKILLVVLVVSFLGSCSTNDKEDHYKPDLKRGTTSSTVILKLKEKGFTSFAKALETAKYDVTLASPKSFTVFAPSNEEFDKATSGLSAEAMKIWLGYHIIEPAFSRIRMVDTIYKTISGKYIKYDPKNLTLLDPYGKKIASFNGSEIVCDNGIIQPINTVLNPINSLAVELKARYPLFFKILTEGFIGTSTVRNYESAFDENGNPYVDSSYAKTYTFINPFDEKGLKTVLAVSDANINETFKNIETAFKGSSRYKKIMHYFYEKMLKKHFYNEPLYSWHFAKGRIPITETSYVDLDTLKGQKVSRMNIRNLLASNGIIHEYDSIMNDLTWKAYLDSTFLNDSVGFNIEYSPWSLSKTYTDFRGGDRDIIRPYKWKEDGSWYEAYAVPDQFENSLRIWANWKIDSISSRSGIWISRSEVLNPVKYVDVIVPNVPGADFMLSLKLSDFYNMNAIVQVSVDGQNIGKPFDTGLIADSYIRTIVGTVATVTTINNPFGDEALRAKVGKPAYVGYRPDVYLGELHFKSFGKKTVRLTIVGTSKYSTSMNNIYVMLNSIRFTPMAPTSKK